MSDVPPPGFNEPRSIGTEVNGAVDFIKSARILTPEQILTNAFVNNVIEEGIPVNKDGAPQFHEEKELHPIDIFAPETPSMPLELTNKLSLIDPAKIDVAFEKLPPDKRAAIFREMFKLALNFRELNAAQNQGETSTEGSERVSNAHSESDSPVPKRPSDNNL